MTVQIEKSKYSTLYDTVLFSPILTSDGINMGIAFYLKGFEDLIFTPTYVFDKEEYPFALGFAIGKNKNKKIMLSSKLFEYSRIEHIVYSVAEVLLHEMIHHRLAHIGRFDNYFHKNSSLTNFVLDLFIGEIVKQVFPNLPSFIIEGGYFFDNFGKVKESLGIQISNTREINIDELKKKDEYELLEYFFSKYDDVYNTLSKFIDEGIQQAMDNRNKDTNANNSSGGQQSNENNSTQNNSGNTNSDSSSEDSNSDTEGDNNNNSSDIDDISDIVNNAYNYVKNKAKQEYSENENFANNFSQISQFGPLDSFVVKEIIRRLLEEDCELSEGEKERNIEKLKEFIENMKKVTGYSGSYFRKIIDTKEKISISNAILKWFSILDRYGHIKHRYIYPKKSMYGRSNVIFGKRKYFGLNLAVIIDTSGSMSSEDIEKSIKVLNYLISQGAVIDLYFNDTEYQVFKNIDSEHKLRKILENGEILGGGGSVFTNVFQETKNKPGILITDLYIDGLDILPKEFLIIATKGYDKDAFDNVRKTNIVLEMELLN